MIASEQLSSVTGGDGARPVLHLEGEPGHGMFRSVLGLSPEQYDRLNAKLTAEYHGGNQAGVKKKVKDLFGQGVRDQASAERNGGLGG